MSDNSKELRVRDLEIDISGAVDMGTRAHTAVSIFVPPSIGDDAVVAFGFPGGGYNRGYFDLAAGLPGPGGSSEARWHAERDWWYVACDHLGVGGSSHLDPELLTIETLAAANDATVHAVCERIEAGTVADTLPPVNVSTRLGFGQSMGGCLTIVAQARHRTFDGIGVLGYSAIHTVLPTPAGSSADQPNLSRVSDELDIASTSAAIGDAVFRYAFHWEDVPTEIVDLDLQQYPLRDHAAVPAWGRHAVPPPSAITMLSPGAVAAEAAEVDVPVLIACGERDVVPDTHAEPTAYASRDVCMFVVPRMAHMHNFAGTRELLWRRIHNWGDRVASDREPVTSPTPTPGVG
jgi:pimeloyl-ACP methyl ester carboxylesterase